MTEQAMSTDVVIVGAGPTGLYGAYYAGFRGLETVVVDVLPHVGGQIAAMYPEKQIRDVAGMPSIRGRDLVDQLAAQAESASARYVLGHQAVGLHHDGDGHPQLALDDGTVIHSRAVVLTGGIGTPRPRPLPVGDEWAGSAISWFVTDPERHRGQDVVVVGGGDSALDWADLLSDVATSVTLVHRRARFRGHAATLARVQQDARTRIVTESELVGLDGDLATGTLKSATLRHSSGEEQAVAADHVIAALGFISDLGPIRDWGLELRGRSVAVDRWMRTNLPRVYAAGDLADFDGKVKLMSIGFGEVALAMNHVAVELDPDLTLFPGHSTDAA